MNANEYRAYAEEAVKMAARSDDDHYKTIMLEVAQGWLDLAERARKRELQPRDRFPQQGETSRRPH